MKALLLLIIFPQISSLEDFEELTYRKFHPFEIVEQLATSIGRGEDRFDKSFEFRDCDGDLHPLSYTTREFVHDALKSFKIFDAEQVEPEDMLAGTDVQYWFDVVLANQHRLNMLTSVTTPLMLIYAGEHNCFPDDAILKTNTALAADEFLKSHSFSIDSILDDFHFKKCDKTSLTKLEFFEFFDLTSMVVLDGVRFEKQGHTIWQFSGMSGPRNETSLQLQLDETTMIIDKGREYPC